MEGFPVAVGVYVNVDRARAFVRGRKPRHRLHVPWAYRQIKKGEVRVKQKHWRWGKLKDEAPIMVKVCGVRTLVDGWHRARRAHSKGKKFIPAHMLTEAEARLCGVPADWFKKIRKLR